MRLRPPPLLIYGIALPLLRSLRVHHFGVEHLRAAIARSRGGAFVGVHWHQSLLGLIGAFQGSGLRLAALASLSGDGAIIGEYLARAGFRLLRGSSARGAARAAVQVIEAMEEGWHVALACDGPRGPARVVKPGPLEIARTRGACVLPCAVRASREWTFRRSWDRFRLPLPAAELAVVYGEPLWFPPAEPTPAELAARCRLVAERLEAQEARATALVRRHARWSRFRPR